MFSDAERSENNLTLLRLLAASAVLFAHSWPAAEGPGSVDPASALLSSALRHPVALSGLAVHAFFVISGYLVTKSAMRRASVARFAAARALRIYPALLLHVAGLALVIGPAATSLPLSEYLGDGKLWKFVVNNGLMWNAAYYLPGVFTDHPFTAANASLWTLPVEIRCYVAIGLFLAVGALRRRRVFAAIWGALLALSVAAPTVLGNPDTAGNIRFFVFGALVCALRDVIPATGLLPAILFGGGVAATTAGGGVYPAAIGFAFSILWIGLIAPRGMDTERVLGDPSYGVYLWAFPIQQLVVAAAPKAGPFLVAMIAAPIVLVIGVLSWRFVERPALALIDHTARRMDSKRRAG